MSGNISPSEQSHDATDAFASGGDLFGQTGSAVGGAGAAHGGLSNPTGPTTAPRPVAPLPDPVSGGTSKIGAIGTAISTAMDFARRYEEASRADTSLDSFRETSGAVVGSLASGISVVLGEFVIVMPATAIMAGTTAMAPPVAIVAAGATFYLGTQANAGIAKGIGNATEWAVEESIDATVPYIIGTFDDIVEFAKAAGIEYLLNPVRGRSSRVGC